MQHQGTLFQSGNLLPRTTRNVMATALSRQIMIGALLVVALLAFELFNFDTTQYALANLLGDVRFLSLRWATILAFAFCAIDFAGLAHLFAPERGQFEPRESWYLMGAWLLGATMNALMTWWAINLTLLEHQFGNEVLSREQLLNFVPIFVAVLVWLTRILFIGAFSVAGDHLFRASKADMTAVPRKQPSSGQRLATSVAARPQREQLSAPEPAPTAEAPTLVRRQPVGTERVPASSPLSSPRNIRPGPLPAGMHAAPRRR